MNLEIRKLLVKGVITKCEHEIGEYITPIFMRQKPDGSCRLILNLKKNKWRYTIHTFLDGIAPVSFIIHYSRMLFGITGL